MNLLLYSDILCVGYVCVLEWKWTDCRDRRRRRFCHSTYARAKLFLEWSRNPVQREKFFLAIVCAASMPQTGYEQNNLKNT